MNIKTLLIVLIPNIFFCQTVFEIPELINIKSKVKKILIDNNKLPSNTKNDEIIIRDFINSKDMSESNTDGIFNVYYHYHFGDYLLYKIDNKLNLYISPLDNIDLMLSEVLKLDIQKKESEKYLKQVYEYFLNSIESGINKRTIIVTPNVGKKHRQKEIKYEQKKLEKKYKFYLKLIKDR